MVRTRASKLFAVVDLTTDCDADPRSVGIAIWGYASYVAVDDGAVA